MIKAIIFDFGNVICSFSMDRFVRNLGEALGMRTDEFRHLTSDPDMAARRESFTDLARVPLPQVTSAARS